MIMHRPRHHRRAGKELDQDWNPKYVVSEEELLNRVILAKCLFVVCSGTTVHFRTETDDMEISPKTARRLLRLAKIAERTQRN